MDEIKPMPDDYWPELKIRGMSGEMGCDFVIWPEDDVELKLYCVRRALWQANEIKRVNRG